MSTPAGTLACISFMHLTDETNKILLIFHIDSLSLYKNMNVTEEGFS